MTGTKRRSAHRVAFVAIGLILLGTLGVLPFAAWSLTVHLTTPPEGLIHPFKLGSAASTAASHSQVHISVVDLEESHLRAKLHVSGHYVCAPGCPYASRLVLFSLGSSEAASSGMPPSASVDLVTSERLVSRSVELPIRGHPTMYPFDTYELWLGVGLADVHPDLTVHPLSRADADGLLLVTIQEQLHREDLASMFTLHPDLVVGSNDPYQLLGLEVLRFKRPLHEQVLAVLLVVLITAAAAYALFIRSIHDLVLSSGGLVLGVWGVRSILTPGSASPTLVDLSLSLVILFLLAGITGRALHLCYTKGDIRLHRGSHGGDGVEADQGAEAPDQPSHCADAWDRA